MAIVGILLTALAGMEYRRNEYIYTLTLDEILPEIRLIAAALLLCIAVSSLPVLVAAHREIGRVLK